IPTTGLNGSPAWRAFPRAASTNAAAWMRVGLWARASCSRSATVRGPLGTAAPAAGTTPPGALPGRAATAGVTAVAAPVVPVTGAAPRMAGGDIGRAGGSGVWQPATATAENEAPNTNARTRARIPHLQVRPRGPMSARQHCPVVMRVSAREVTELDGV